MLDVDSLLNGSPAVPLLSTPSINTAPAAATPGATAGATALIANRASRQTVLFVWIGLVVLLVLAHVLTVSLQR